MKPIILHLRGSIGIRDGLGLEEITIDFSNFSPGLVCLVGPNGSGKTSILDNIHPYLCLASRSGHLGSHFYLNNSYRDFTFEIGTTRYRSLILIDASSGKSEAYLYMNDFPLNDGKIATYKETVESLIGPPELFFKSIFSGQGADGFTDLPPAKRKELFFELLNLQKYDIYSQDARDHAEELERQLAAAKAIIAQGSEELQQRDNVLSDIETLNARLSTIHTTVANEECELDRINKAQQGLHQKLESRIRLRKEATALDEEIGLLAIRLRKIGENYVLEKKKLGLRSQSIVKELERLRKICARREEITARVDDLNRLREEASKLDLLERKAYEITQREAAARAAYQKEYDVFQKNRAKLTRERDSFLSEQRLLRKMLDQELAICEMDLERARQEAALIDTVACRTIEGIPEQCVLLSKAIGARKSLPDLERKTLIIRSQEYAASKGAANLQESIRVWEEKLAAHETSAPVFDEGKFQDERKDLGYDRTSHEYLRKEISAIEKKGWESLLDELKIAETLQSEKESSLAAIEEQLDELRVKFEKDLVEAEAVIGDKKARRLEIVIDEDLMDESSFDQQRTIAKKKLEQLRREEVLLAGDLASARTKLDTLQTIEERTRQAEAEVIRLEQSITDWRLIQRACSKDGIPALELDAAGPAISHIANELLASSFGNGFQIRFETTRLSKDNKKQLETFDVRVYGEDGEKSIEELSGGERVWVERAIAEAIAIHLSSVSQHKFQTTFQDEADGPLDPENKQKYLAMLRESFRIGRRDFAFIVSQTPDIWQQVDQRIHLDPERSRIDYVCGG